MQQPPWTAGPRLPSPLRAGGALALSVLAHAVALAVWVHATQPSSGPARFSQKHGGITVQLISTAARTAPRAVVATVQPAINSISAINAAAQPRTVPVALAPIDPPRQDIAPTPTPAAQAASEPASSPPQPAVTAAPGASQVDSESTPPATPPAANPGARFASLFAPLVSMPMGRGQWHNTATFKPPQEAMAAMQREQAIAGTRQAVMRQTQVLQQLLQSEPLMSHCDIRLSLERQRGELHCAEQDDFRRVATAFQGTLNLDTALPPQPADRCLHAQAHSLAWTACPDPVITP